MTSHPDKERSLTHLPDVIESRLSLHQQRDYNVAVQAAASVLNRRVRVLRLIRDAYIKLHSEDEAMRRMRGDMIRLLRLLKAWALGEYQQLPWRSAIFACAGLLYFLLPIDLIPDFVPGIGYLDDALVVGAVVSSLKSDLRRFEQARQRQLEENATATIH